MTANLFFPQVPSDTHLPDTEAGMTRVFGQRRASVTKNCVGSSMDQPESFLTSLSQLSKEHKPTNESTGSSSGEKFAVFDDIPLALETGMTERSGQLGEDPSNGEGLMLPDLNLAAVLTALENLGLYESPSDSGLAIKIDGDLENANDVAALKVLITRLGKSGFLPSDEIKTELARLPQFLANVQTDNTMAGKDGSRLGELTDRQSTAFSNLSQLIESTVSAQEDLRGSHGNLMGQSDLGKEPSDPFADPNQGAKKLAAVARAVGIEANEHSRKTSQVEPVHSNIPGKTEASGGAEPLNRASSIIDAVKQIGGQSAQEKLPPNEPSSVIHMANTAQTARTESQGQQYAGETFQNHRVNSQSSANTISKNPIQAAITPGCESGPDDPTNQNHAVKNDPLLAIKMANDVQAAKTAIRGQQHVGETVQNHTVPSEASLVSTMIHDAQMAKEHPMRMDAAMGDEISGKIPRVDVGANDNGLLNPQNHTPDKSFEAAFLSKQTETAQDSLRTQALDQIVRKAVINIRNGHHEAKIDLKPDFLGHVRLQVTTENQMVTVKILIESGFVKDMVENSIHQLKADLQQQGLSVDKVEVAVSSDSDEYKHPHEKAGQAKERQRSDASNNPDDRERETRKHSENSTLGPSSTGTVDYFA